MYRKKLPAQQQTMWLPTSEIVSTAATSFYQKLDDALESFDFTAQVHQLCDPFYCTNPSRGGRPGIDPVVYFKMLVIGFFENISSERGIAARCVDVDIRPGDEGDTQELAKRVLDAEERMNIALGQDEDTATMTILGADKGHYQVDQLTELQQLGIKTVISDPIES